jgi:hypothetical protein
MRIHSAPLPDIEAIHGIVPIHKGGTDASNIVAASVALSAVSKSRIGKPGGPIPLREGSKVDESALPSSLAPAITVEGPREIFVNDTVHFEITNFDTQTTYAVSCNQGSISRIGPSITYRSPSIPLDVQITINGRVLNFKIKNIGPYTPEVISPTNLSENLAENITIRSSDYQSAGSHTHVSSDWQIGFDQEFRDLFYESTLDVANRTSLPLEGLPTSTSLYVRVRYRDSQNQVSDWSDTVVFVTRPVFGVTLEDGFISPSSRTSGDALGTAVAISQNGTRMVAGAPGRLSNSGTVIVSALTDRGWWQEAQITLPSIFTYSDSVIGRGTDVIPMGQNTVTRTIPGVSAVAGDRFGMSVAISADGDRIVVGAPNKTITSGPQGMCFVFKRTGISWHYEATLTASQASVSRQFGRSVSISADGTRIAVGSPGEDGDDGTVYLYERTVSTWTERTRYPTDIGSASDRFGECVRLSGDGLRLAVGAPGHRLDDVADVGAVRVYNISNSTIWTVESTLFPDDSVTTASRLNYSFGKNLDINYNGTRLAVCVPGRESQKGAVWLFNRYSVDWSRTLILTVNNTNDNNIFGSSCSLSDNGKRLLVGANAKTGGHSYAYLFREQGINWSQLSKFRTDSWEAGDQFGASVDISGDTKRMVIGNPSATVSYIAGTGAAHIFN